MREQLPSMPDGEFLPYQTEDGRSRIEVRLQGETVWLTQNHMAEMSQTSKQNASQHLKAVYESGGLEPAATVKKSLTVRQEDSQ